MYFIRALRDAFSKKINENNFSQLHNVMEHNVVRPYSQLELPLHAQRFGLASSKCPVAYNPDCTLKQMQKKYRERMQRC